MLLVKSDPFSLTRVTPHSYCAPWSSYMGWMWGMAHPSMNGFSDIKPLHCKTYVFYIYIIVLWIILVYINPYIYIHIYYIYGGFQTWGYPKSSIYRWIFHLGNHPAIGVSPFQETSIYEYAPCCPEPGNRDAWTKRCPRWLVSRASASKCPMGWGFEKGYYPSYMWWWNMGFNVV